MRDFLAAGAQIGTASLEGALAGEQQRMQQQQQALAQQNILAQMAHQRATEEHQRNQEEQQRRGGYLDAARQVRESGGGPGSYGPLLARGVGGSGQRMGAEGARGLLGGAPQGVPPTLGLGIPNPAARQSMAPQQPQAPDTRQLLQYLQGNLYGPPQVPGEVSNPPVGGQPTTARGQEAYRYGYPGGGEISLTEGVGKPIATATMAALNRLRETRRKTDLSGNPVIEALVDAELENAPVEVSTPEQLRAAQAVLNGNAGRYLGQYAAQAQTLAETKLKTDRTQYEEDIDKNLPGLNDEALMGALPGFLTQERSIRERLGTRGYGGRLAGSEVDVEEIDRLRKAGDEEGARELARRIRGRLNARVDSTQESQKQRDVLARLGKLDPSKVTPEVVRATYDKAGIGYLVNDLPNEALMYGGAAMRKELNKSLGDLNRWKDLNPAAQKVALDHLAYLAQFTEEKIEIPAEVVSKMTPYQKEQVGFAGARVTIARAQAATSAYQAVTARDRLVFDKARHEWMKAHPPAGKGGVGGAGALTQNQKASALFRAWEQASKEYDALFGKYPRPFSSKFDYDPIGTYQQGTPEYKAQQIYNHKLALEQQYREYVLGGGAEKERATATPTTAPPSATTPSVRVQEFRPPAGMTPQQYRQRAYTRLRKRGKSDAEINAFLRAQGAM